MALVTGGRSTLNPNAPLFIPAAFRQVEDFSPEWWQLITTSTWFRDYWLSQHQEEEIFGNYNNADDGLDVEDIADLLPDTFDFGADDDFLSMEAQFEEFIQSSETREGSKPSHHASNGAYGDGSAVEMDANAMMKFTNERGSRNVPEPAKYQEKPGRCMSPKCSPRRIHQPR